MLYITLSKGIESVTRRALLKSLLCPFIAIALVKTDKYNKSMIKMFFQNDCYCLEGCFV